jgi:hypothetical protein
MLLTAACLILIYNSDLLQRKNATATTTTVVSVDRVPIGDALPEHQNDDGDVNNVKKKGRKEPHSFNLNRVRKL